MKPALLGRAHFRVVDRWLQRGRRAGADGAPVDENLVAVQPRVLATLFAGIALAMGLQHFIVTGRQSTATPVTGVALAVEPSNGTAAGHASSTAATVGKVAVHESVPAARTSPLMVALINSAPRSPLGRLSEGVTSSEALGLADTYLRGLHGARRSRVEAAYWLRHALAPLVQDPRTAWALTQLGSVYAEPEAGVPDYKAASAVWQIAASLDDPIATCFLARMYQFGRGVPVDHETARRLYGLALASGGCPGLMQALGQLD